MTDAVGKMYVELRGLLGSFQKDMNQGVGIARKAGQQIDQIGKNMGATFKLALGVLGVQSVRGFANSLAELANKGEVAGSIADQFERLGGNSSAIEAAKKGVLGMVDSFDLMAIANKALLGGMPQINEKFGLIAETSAQLADTLNLDTKSALEGVTDALTRGNPKALEQYKIIVNQKKAWKDYADSTGQTVKELDKFEKRQAITNAGLKELEELHKRLAPAGDSVANAWDSMQTQLGEMAKQAGIAVNENEDLRVELRQLQDVLSKIDWSKYAGDLATATAAMIDFGVKGVEYVTDKLKDLATWHKVAQLRSELMYESNIGYAEANQKATDIVTTAENNRATIEERAYLKRKAAMAEEAKARLGAIDLVHKLGGAEEDTSEKSDKAAKKRQKDAEKLAKELEKQQEALDEQNKKLAEIDTKGYEDLARTIEDAFMSGLQGGTASLSDSLEQVAVKFGSQLLAAMMTGGNVPQGSAAGGGMNGLIGMGVNTILGWFGGGAAEAAPVYGPGLPNVNSAADSKQLAMDQQISDIAGYVGAASNVIGSISSAKGIDAANRDNSGTGGAVGSTLGTGIGAVFGGPIGAQIGGQLGQIAGSFIGGFFKRGPQNPDTIARHAFSGWIEEQLEKLGEVTFYDNQGKLKEFSGNFLEGDNKQFNDPNWAGAYNATESSKAWTGLGQAMEEILELTEDVGSQLGVLMQQNFGDNIDNARLLVQYLGLDIEQVTEKLVDAGKRGEMSWHEVEVNLQGVSQAFEKGLAKANAYGDAFDHIVDSGGRGFDAIKAIRDVGEEALEAKIKDMETLKAKLIEEGKDPEFVNAMFEGFAQRGIKTIEAIANLTDRDAGGVIADMQSKSNGLAKIWEDMNEKLKENVGLLKEIPEQIESRIRLKWESEVDDKTQELLDTGVTPTVDDLPEPDAFARGGVVSRAARFRHAGGLGVMGEAGPEAILPLARVNGRLGVYTAGRGGSAGGVVYNIDAREAGPGVEAKIREVLKEFGAGIAIAALDRGAERSWRRGE